MWQNTKQWNNKKKINKKENITDIKLKIQTKQRDKT